MPSLVVAPRGRTARAWRLILMHCCAFRDGMYSYSCRWDQKTSSYAHCSPQIMCVISSLATYTDRCLTDANRSIVSVPSPWPQCTTAADCHNAHIKVVCAPALSLYASLVFLLLCLDLQPEICEMPESADTSALLHGLLGIDGDDLGKDANTKVPQQRLQVWEADLPERGEC